MKKLIKLAALSTTVCLALGSSAFAAVTPGTYTDGTSTMVIAEDMTFSMEKAAENTDGAQFNLTITGTISEDGKATLTGLYDGELNLFDLATPEQIAADTASADALIALAGEGEKSAKTPYDLEAGSYTDGELTLELSADHTFKMDKTGTNMEGAEFVLTVTGKIAEDGSVEIDGLYDGEINLIEMASEEQIAADMASVESVLKAACSEEAAEETAEKTWESYIQYLNDVLDLDPSFELYSQIKGELAEAKEADYTGMTDGTLFGAMQHSFGAVSYEEFEPGMDLPDVSSALTAAQ